MQGQIAKNVQHARGAEPTLINNHVLANSNQVLQNTQMLDSYLVTRICQQDEQALALLYDRYSAFIYSLALRITDDRTMSEAIVLDVFSAVWRFANSFPTGTSVPRWLIRMTRRSVQQTISFDGTNIS